MYFCTSLGLNLKQIVVRDMYPLQNRHPSHSVLILLEVFGGPKSKALPSLFSCVKNLQDDIQNRAASFASVVKDIEGFLEENQTKLSPQELTALREKLHQAKEQYEALQERTRVAQKELEEVVTSALQQETEKVTRLL